MQVKSDVTIESAKASFKSLALHIEDDRGERGHEHEMSSLIGSSDQVVLQLQTPLVDLELVHGFGDHAFEQQEELECLDIGDGEMTSSTIVDEEMDAEISTGIGDDQEVDHQDEEVDTELLLGVGDAMATTIVKINSVWKLNNS